MQDRYRILREIGRGATGTVFEAVDALTGEHVAVKILRTAMRANPVARQRFLREVEAASRVDHPVIIKIYGWGEQEDLSYIVMEFVDGQPLSKLLSPIAPFPLVATVRIVHQVASGLAAVHRAGLVHRDIKPDNIMVLKETTVKLSDFGVAKFPDSAVTQAGELWGTLSYMSPEQVQGKLNVDAQSDIFSLGVVLFELLSCRRPFDGDSIGAALVRRIVEDPVPRVSTLKPGIPEVFDILIARALAKKPGDRYTASEFAQALKEVLPFLRLG